MASVLHVVEDLRSSYDEPCFVSLHAQQTTCHWNLETFQSLS